MTDGHAHRLGR